VVSSGTPQAASATASGAATVIVRTVYGETVEVPSGPQTKIALSSDQRKVAVQSNVRRKQA